MTAIVDTHCHYNLPPLLDQWQSHWQKAQAQNVVKSIVIGTEIHSLKAAIEMAAQETGIFCGAGIHPTQVNTSKFDDFATNFQTQVKELMTYVKNHTTNKIVAIGETGLDYYRLDKRSADAEMIISTQKQLFISQLKLAQELQLPVVLHIRDTNDQAYNDAAELLSKYDIPQIILHCFSGSEQFIKAMISRGAFFGVDGHITYPSNTLLRTQLMSIPSDHVLLETDAPYLPPQAYRGKVCEPWMITLTTDFLASQLGFDLEQIYNNSHQAFPGII